MAKVPNSLHRILVTFYDGSASKYTTAVMHGDAALQDDPAVVEILDLDTYEILYTVA